MTMKLGQGARDERTVLTLYSWHMIVILVVEVLFLRFELPSKIFTSEHTLSESTFLCYHACFLVVMRVVITF